MRWIAAWAVAGAVLVAPATSTAAPPDEGSSTTTTTPGPIPAEGGAPVPAPSGAPSAPLVPIPGGCPVPPVASVVFVGRMIAKVTDVARFRIEQIRAGGAPQYIYGDLIDIHYDNETQYLSVDDRYLVGAAPAGPNLELTSKVRESEPLFGGNAVIGLTEKSASCPPNEDPVRTLHVDGTEVDNSMLMGLSSNKRDIAFAVLAPLAVAIGVVLVLATVRWLFTGFFLTARRAVGGPRPTSSPTRRRIG